MKSELYGWRRLYYKGFPPTTPMFWFYPGTATKNQMVGDRLGLSLFLLQLFLALLKASKNHCFSSSSNLTYPGNKIHQHQQGTPWLGWLRLTQSHQILEDKQGNHQCCYIETDKGKPPIYLCPALDGPGRTTFIRSDHRGGSCCAEVGSGKPPVCFHLWQSQSH